MLPWDENETISCHYWVVAACHTVVGGNTVTQTILSSADYVTNTNTNLMPDSDNGYSVLDLFAGCGGLSLGFESVGFATLGFEMYEHCCLTYNNNLHGRCMQKMITPDMKFPKTDVIIGGPPCQPFSVIGRQTGCGDERDGFPSFVSAVKKTHPALWMFENVRGVLYKNRDYFEETIHTLQKLGYHTEYRILNMSQYGVPQNRLRVIAIGHDCSFRFPSTRGIRVVNSGEALHGLYDMVSTDTKFLTARMDKYIATYEKKSQVIHTRDLNLNRPARTVTCRNLAGATSDMHRIRLADGRRRMLTVREGARLQSFPDWFDFTGTQTQQFYQIGNAVPPLFARVLAMQIRSYLDGVVNPSIRHRTE